MKVSGCFVGGFALLPFLWLINSVWFFRDAFLAEAFDEQKRIRSCEYIRCCGFIIYCGSKKQTPMIFSTNSNKYGPKLELSSD